MKISLISNGSIFVFCLGWPKTFFQLTDQKKDRSQFSKLFLKDLIWVTNPRKFYRDLIIID